jgi:hypothetical protein
MDRCREDCPFEERIKKLDEKVIIGNGDSSLLVRASELETKVNDLVKIVKGDGETTGLQTHVIEFRAGQRIIIWLLSTGIAIGLGLVTIMGFWMTHFEERNAPGVRTTHQSDRYVPRGSDDASLPETR